MRQLSRLRTKRFGAKVYEQEAMLTAYDNTGLEAKNIIGSFNPENNKRILLFAHWDSRPYSDHDPDPANHRKAIDGADDGASGVGALLEIARQIGQKDPGVGIDIIFFDAEDYGTPEFVDVINPTPGVWVPSSGQRIRTYPITAPTSVSCWIWSELKTPLSSRNRLPLSKAGNIVEMVWSTGT